MQEVFAATRDALQGYADRGIFQNFKVSEPDRSGVGDFRFHWLAEQPFHLRLHLARGELELKDVLPAVPYRSEMDRDFRNFLKARCDASLPDHRRLDADRFALRCRNRDGKLSVLIGFQQRDADAAARSAIQLLHEIFNNFLMEGPYQNYMVEVFNVPEE